MMSNEELAPYGLCPACGEVGVMRDRGLGGNDRCRAGCSYPSSAAIKVRAVKMSRKPTHPGIAFMDMVLSPHGITIDMLLGKERVNRDAARSLGELSGTSQMSWYKMQEALDEYEVGE